MSRFYFEEEDREEKYHLVLFTKNWNETVRLTRSKCLVDVEAGAPEHNTTIAALRMCVLHIQENAGGLDFRTFTVAM